MKLYSMNSLNSNVFLRVNEARYISCIYHIRYKLNWHGISTFKCLEQPRGLVHKYAYHKTKQKSRDETDRLCSGMLSKEGLSPGHFSGIARVKGAHKVPAVPAASLP